MPAYRDIYGNEGSSTGSALSGVRSLTAPSFRAGGGTRVPTTGAATISQDPNAAQSSGLLPKGLTITPPRSGRGSWGGVASPGQPPALPSPGQPPALPSPDQPPDYQNSNDNLAMWGYTGEIPINNVEQQAIDFVNQMYGSGGGLETMGGAQDYYQKVLSGEYGPEGQAYLQQVLDPMRSRMTSDYNDMSKALATKFSDYGGYFGGRHGVAQGRLASDAANNMATTEAGLRYQLFGDNANRMGGAAQGLQSLGQAQSGVSGEMLNQLLSTGGMITGRDALNRSEYQGALQRSYSDWLRARQEQLMPFTMGANLIGQQATQPIVTQTQSPWGAALGALGSIGGSFATGGLSKLL